MYKKFKSNIGQLSKNFFGKYIKRKIVVFESDDWGSIRIPNKEALIKLRNFGFNVNNCGYVLNDALEDNSDMELLFDMLSRKKRPPIITANFLTANPDFNKIKESNFEFYFNQTIDETVVSLPNRDKLFQYYNEGIENKFMRPQLHGREHLNIYRWMNDLKNGNKETIYAFELETFGISANVVNLRRLSYQAAFDDNEYDSYLNSHYQIIEDAVKQFERLFGFPSISFIAPNYIWNEKIEQITSEFGIKFIQAGNYNRLFSTQHKKYIRNRHFFGSKNQFNQTYLIRNCEFEPFSDLNKDWINNCLKEIKIAFMLGKPAVISMHRVNFIGSINSNNRSRNLKLFSNLIDEIIKKWPEVEFLSSDQLANEIL